MPDKSITKPSKLQTEALKEELFNYKPLDLLDICINLDYDEEMIDVCGDEEFWKEKTLKDFGNEFSELQDPDFVPEGTWRDEYQYFYRNLQQQLVDHVRNYDIRNLERLLKMGINPNSSVYSQQGGYMWPVIDEAITVAVKQQSSEILELLLEYGIDVKESYLLESENAGAFDTINGRPVIDIFRKAQEKIYSERVYPDIERPLESYKYLSDAVELRRLEGNIGGKSRVVYLIYDVHITKGGCLPKTKNVISVDYWIKRVLSEYNDVDVFLESIETKFKDSDIKKFLPLKETRIRSSEMFLLEEYINDDSLGRAIVDLYPCYSFNTKDCPYTGNRVHFVDIRNISLQEKITEVAFYSPVNALKEVTKVFEKYKGKVFSKENVIDYYLKNTKRGKIAKQWKMGPFKKEWREIVEKYLEIYYDQEIDRYPYKA